MHHTGLDPLTGEGVSTAKRLRGRRLRRAPLRSFKPENDFEVREALIKADRRNLIGAGCDALISANHLKAALRSRMERRNRSLTEGEYVHTIRDRAPAMPPGPPAPAPGACYRPKRKTAKRRPR